MSKLSLKILGPTTPCSKEDNKCLEVLLNGIFYDVIGGIPALNISATDPLIIDYIDEKFSILDYEAYNETITGIRNIRIYDVS